MTVTAVTNSKGYNRTTRAAAKPVITAGNVQVVTRMFIETSDTKNVGTGTS